ncbi:MAG: ParB/RepB/Spo0J family partition protein [Pseudomonadota bacterium]|nr:ParB/RepB/Spo0J family partition protein [Pseudomonadota bacterium]
MSVKKRGLGRGLDSLLGTVPGKGEAPGGAERLQHLPIEFLSPGPHQPRQVMSQAALEELAESIRAQGIVQPIVVRALGADRYEIIAGERRWRAAQLAGLATVPCVVREVSDRAATAIALIENIQREDLSPMEEAQALDRLRHEFELTHQQVADAVGRSRATVTNLMRLIELNSDVKERLQNRELEMGHARALLGLNGRAQSEAAKAVVDRGLTVRQTEKLVRATIDPPQKKGADSRSERVDADVARLQEELSECLGARVTLQHREGKGKVVIHYHSLDELDGIIRHLK